MPGRFTLLALGFPFIFGILLISDSQCFITGKLFIYHFIFFCRVENLWYLRFILPQNSNVATRSNYSFVIMERE